MKMLLAYVSDKGVLLCNYSTNSLLNLLKVMVYSCIIYIFVKKYELIEA